MQGFVCIHPVGRLFFDYPVTNFSTGSLLSKKKKKKEKLTTCFKLLENHFYNPLGYPLFSPGTNDFYSCLWALPGFFKILVFAKYT